MPMLDGCVISGGEEIDLLIVERVTLSLIRVRDLNQEDRSHPCSAFEVSSLCVTALKHVAESVRSCISPKFAQVCEIQAVTSCLCSTAFVSVKVESREMKL